MLPARELQPVSDVCLNAAWVVMEGGADLLISKKTIGRLIKFVFKRDGFGFGIFVLYLNECLEGALAFAVGHLCILCSGEENLSTISKDLPSQIFRNPAFDILPALAAIPPRL